MKNSLVNFSNSLQREMLEMRKLGEDIPEKAFALAKDLTVIEEYQSMKNFECVDLLISIAKIKD